MECERSSEPVVIGEVVDQLMEDLEVLLFLEELVSDREHAEADR